MRRIALALGLAIFCITLSAIAKNPAAAVKPETISGTLTIVGAEDKLIFVKAENGITYDFRIGPATKITAGEEKLKFDSLTEQVGKRVEVVFRPLKTGNAALTVDIK
jgi:hypothetical protein